MAKKARKQAGDNPTNPTSLSSSQERLLIELFNSRAIVTEACKKARVDRSTHYAWMKDNEEYAQAYRDIEETAIDFVEGMMFERIEEGSDGLIKFYLATKGKKRGYIEKQQIEVSGELDIKKLSDEELDEQIRLAEDAIRKAEKAGRG